MSEKLLHLPCYRCGESVGAFTQLEIVQMGDYSAWTEVLCFNCETDLPDEIPSLFGDWEEGDLVWIDDELFIALRSDDLRGDWVALMRASAHARARSCLSSSTYLNKEPLTDLPMGDVTTTSMICPVCLLGMAKHVVDGWRCDICNWYRPDVKVCPICDLGITLLGKSGWLCDICGYFEPVPSRDSEG